MAHGASLCPYYGDALLHASTHREQVQASQKEVEKCSGGRKKECTCGNWGERCVTFFFTLKDMNQQFCGLLTKVGPEKVRILLKSTEFCPNRSLGPQVQKVKLWSGPTDRTECKFIHV